MVAKNPKRRKHTREAKTSGAKRTRRPPRAATASPKTTHAQVTKLRRGVSGSTAFFGVTERQGDSLDRQEASIVVLEPVATRRRGRRPHVSAATARRLAAVGHPMRVMLLTHLLEGPAVYKSLSKVTGLGAGPLYHHINCLRLAGLIRPPQRDVYELTRCGRNVILLALALDKLGTDLRARPVGGTGKT